MQNHALSLSEVRPDRTYATTVLTGLTFSLLLGVSERERSYREKYRILRSYGQNGGPVRTPANTIQMCGMGGPVRPVDRPLTSPRAIARHPPRHSSGAMSPHPDLEICFTPFGSRLGRKLVAKWRGA